ncbi:MAG: DMT family transporter [Anaerolineales bacterium]|nr:DMT family transporter [Anaerolineales bacterium]
MPPFPFAGELAALAASLFFSIGPTFFTLSGRLIGSAVLNRSRLLLATSVLILIHWLLYGQPLPFGSDLEHWGWFALSGVIGLTLGDAALFQAFVQIGPRLSMLVYSLAPIVTAVLGWLWLGDRLSPPQALGIGVTLLGVLWVVSERQESSGTQIEPRAYASGLFLALLGAIGQAIGLVTARQGFEGDMAVLSGQVLRMGTAAVAIWLFAILRGQVGNTFNTLRANPLGVRFMMLAVAFGPVMGVWTSLASVKYAANIGVASTLQSLPPIFLIAIGYFFFKERVSWRAMVGTLVALTGVALLFIL